MSNHEDLTHSHDLADAEADPIVVDAVHSVRDRFGVSGLRDMARLAEVEVAVAEDAMRELG